MRHAKSFAIEPDINSYVDETKGDRSASDRVNPWLRRAILQERYDQLEAEAAEFWACRSEAHSVPQPARPYAGPEASLSPPPSIVRAFPSCLRLRDSLAPHIPISNRL
jgi:hypothetical protein